jgi:expansin (peptidoglycan-binding protein)
VSHFLFDHEQKGSDPNANPLCGRKIRATRFNEAAGGKRSVDLTVVDRCTGGQPTDLDVTISVFKKLANVDDGRVQVQWAWLGDEPS